MVLVGVVVLEEFVLLEEIVPIVVVVLVEVVLIVVVLIVVVGTTGNVKLKLLHKLVRQQVASKTALFDGTQKLLHPA